MQGIVGGGLLVAAFVAVAGLALLLAVRLYRLSRPGQLPAQPPGAGPAAGRSAGGPLEPPDA